MSMWADRIHGHPVQQTFASVLSTLKGLTSEQIAQGPQEVERLVWVVNHVRERLNAAPAMAVPHQTLEQLNLQLANLNTEIGNFTNLGNAAYLGNANTQVDGLLELARVLPPLSGDGAVKEAENYLHQVRGIVASVVGDVDADRSRVRADSEATLEQMKSAKEALTAQLDAVAAEVATLQAQAAQQSGQLEELLTAQRAQFDQGEANRVAAFKAAEDERTQNAEAAAAEAQERFASTSGELTEQAAGTLARLEELQGQAEELVGAIGVTGVAAGYDQTAAREKRAADLWRRCTVGVALVAAGILAFALFVDHGEEGGWQRLAARGVVSLSLAGVAAYCGRQSAEHRKGERDARARHLQLRALNPYLANMPEEESVRLKAELAPGYFAPATAGTGTEGDGEQAGSQITAKLLELANTLATKGGNR